MSGLPSNPASAPAPVAENADGAHAGGWRAAARKLPLLLAPQERRTAASRAGRRPPHSVGKSTSSVSERPHHPAVSFLGLYRFATLPEKFLMFFSCLCAAVHGAMLPMWTIIVGSVVTTFSNPKLTRQLVREIGGIAKWYLILAVISFVASYFQVRLQLYVAQQSGVRIRKLYFNSLLRQEFEWYDSESAGELTARVASDVDLIQGGIGDTVGSAVQFTSMFVVGILIALAYSWKMTLVIVAFLPLLAVVAAAIGRLTAESTSEGQHAYAEAGAVASEVLSLIRTVTAYGGQEEEARRYETLLKVAYKRGVEKSFYAGLGVGALMLIIFTAYSISFWYGAKLIRQNQLRITDLFVAFFSVLIGALGIGQASPSFESFAIARGAAPRVFDIIDRQSTIDPLSADGKILHTVHGKISLENVEFNYKSREREGGAPVIKNINLEFLPGTSHALVGPSGCGKSSTMGLIERFYDPDAGRVLLDGVDVRELNVRWLRSQMGFVGQMPSLFRGTIRENIAFGAPLSNENVGKSEERLMRCEVSEEEIIAAAKLANAHSFISELPDGYNTVLGERGALLSGGQKQRICIARAVVRNPKILLLDEATSALDAMSEHVVQEALERASEGRTTIVVAHRLSTIRNADVISVFSEGTIVESGPHDDLVQRVGGFYYQLMEQQSHQSQSNLNRMVDMKNTTEEHTRARTLDRPSQRAASSLDNDENVTYGGPAKLSTSDVDSGVILRAFKMNRAEWAFILTGMLGAIIAGASWPLGALVFSEVTSLLGDPRKKREIVFWARIVAAIGGGAFIGNVLQFGMLGISGERLTQKMRVLSFQALLRQEIGYFDDAENSVGALSTRLATESSLVKGITGNSLGIVTFTLSTVGLGLGIAFAACWRLALVVLSLIPFVAAGGYFQVKMMSGFDAGSKREFASAGSVASEAVDNIRTVTSLGIQDIFINKYADTLVTPLKNGNKAANVTGIAFGVGEGFTFVMWAAAFWAGSKFIAQGHCTFLELMKAVAGLLFAGLSLGSVAALLPNLSESSVAATKIFRLLDRKSKIDPSVQTGGSLDGFQGAAALKEAEFSYPSRPEVNVLRGLSLIVLPGKTLALVGKSGCGKSTVVSLLERFYDVHMGSIKLDDTELRSASLGSARSQMALVQQEPDLFNRTIRENILYGLSQDNGTPVTEAQVIEAARAANAHSFVSELPLGYDTVVGERGSGLSGGQRQRVAIARSLIRKPRLLLLDEATSALDGQSEREVQNALDEARQGRTTIVIAHRLSTVMNADTIGVVSQGRIVELGTHDELMAMKGQYAELVERQVQNKVD